MLKLTQELFGADDPDMKREQAPDEDRMQTLMISLTTLTH